MGKDDRFDDGFSEVVVVAPSHGIGHNMGPEWLPVGTELQEKVETHYATLIARAKELIEKQGAFLKCETPADLKRSTEYVAQLQEAITRLASAYDLEGAPYRTAQAQVRGILGMPKDDLDAIKKAVEVPMTAYNAAVLRQEREKREAEAKKKRDEEAKAREEERKAAEAARKAREEAQRKIDEDRARQLAKDKSAAAKPKLPGKAVFKAIEKADELDARARAARDLADDKSAEAHRAAKHAGAKAADVTRQRSPNAIQSGQEFVDFRDFDRAKFDPAQVWAFIKTEHIESALRDYARVNATDIKKRIAKKEQPLVGVEFFINLRTNVRR